MGQGAAYCKTPKRGRYIEVLVERKGTLGWKVRMEKSKEEGTKRWERGKKEREEGCLVGLSDASERGGRMGLGGVLWKGRRKLRSWKNNVGWGLTVGEREMEGVGRVLERVLEYEGGKRKLVVGVDNKGVLLRLRKGRGLCGECEQRVRERGKELLRRGWEICWEWVPGHVGIMENVEVDKLAREGVWMEEDRLVGGVLTWGKWEQMRKEKERRSWKEYWTEKRKGEVYFGSGSSGERGHGRRRWESVFLFWMRVGHGRMRGTRYGKGKVKCECGEEESRDHILLYCGRWEEERREMLDKWKEEGGDLGGWIDMEGILFSKEGTRLVKEFGRKIKWMELRWNERVEWEAEKEEKRRRWRNKDLEVVNLSRREEERKEKEKMRGRRRRKLQKEMAQSRVGRPNASRPILGIVSGNKRGVGGDWEMSGEKR